MSKTYTSAQFCKWMKSLDLNLDSVSATLRVSRRSVSYWRTSSDSDIPYTVTLACKAISAGLAPVVKVERPARGRPKSSITGPPAKKRAKSKVKELV